MIFSLEGPKGHPDVQKEVGFFLEYFQFLYILEAKVIYRKVGEPMSVIQAQNLIFYLKLACTIWIFASMCFCPFLFLFHKFSVFFSFESNQSNRTILRLNSK